MAETMLDTSTRILAIRHGETDWNRGSRIQGHIDIPLNEMGRLQARRLAEALAGETLDVIYSSDLGRARETAAAVAAVTGAPLQLEPALRERAFGAFEGLSFDEIAERWPEDSERWRKRDLSFAPPGGESIPLFYERCVPAVLRLAQAHPGRSIAVVAHGGVLDCLYRAGARLALEAPRSWMLGNATINRLLYSPEGLTVVGWNDDFHLANLSLDELT
ncbi:histidine phosphatase family protein [Pelomonas sp. KK5]|uniref:histidine phosphatase family protein n=1 Tax=Pelomonas sp. KK5 TaxID=1855730 RepID=UPI001E4B0A9D|nr:histidine phosphatase family protein [Pelomonas sp. KK5]